tara:strand:- start:141 stop:710 length:570 start_codon:yes stop_codon:yes gene_type:complete
MMNPIVEQYNNEVDALPEIHSRGGGAARNASGLVYENLIKRTCDGLGLDAKKNDYFRTKEINGRSLRTLQVDWHVYNNGKLTKLVESKTYLDRCYLERAVTDFIKLNQSPDVPNDAEYCIFAGQDACASDALEYYKEYFKHETGKELTIFFVNPQRKRSSSRPIYKSDYRHLFNLDDTVYDNFIKWVIE